MESIEQNKALMKLLQAFRMPVHINVLLGSTQSEIRLSGSQPGNGLHFSSLFPAWWKSLGTQGCSAGRAAGCQGNEGAWFYFYVTLGWGKERKDNSCFMIRIKSLDAQTFSSSFSLPATSNSNSSWGLLLNCHSPTSKGGRRIWGLNSSSKRK